MMCKVTVCSIVVLVLVFTGSAEGETLYVQEHYSTIQEAVDASSTGDTILVEPDIYPENVRVENKSLTIESTAGCFQTTIDGKLKDVCIAFINAGNSALIGFEIVNGRGWLTRGGGIHVGSSSPVITDNYIHSNYSWWSGGGIYVEIGAPIIKDNIISDNYLYDGFGGGIYAGFSNVTIERNVINGNLADDNGGGIALESCSNISIESNKILENYSTIGGGIFLSNVAGTIRNNFIGGNSSIDSGSGIYLDTETYLDLVNNTICGNKSNNFFTGCMHCSDSTVYILNTIFWHDTGRQNYRRYEISLESTNGYPTFCRVEFSCIEGVEDSILVGSGCTLDWRDGNFSADPLFKNEANHDFHLRSHSACIDVGLIDPLRLTQLDIDGEPRIMAGNVCQGFDWPLVDVGADEYNWRQNPWQKPVLKNHP